MEYRYADLQKAIEKWMEEHGIRCGEKAYDYLCEVLSIRLGEGRRTTPLDTIYREVGQLYGGVHEDGVKHNIQRLVQKCGIKMTNGMLISACEEEIVATVRPLSFEDE